MYVHALCKPRPLIIQCLCASNQGTITYWSPQWGMLSYGDASVVPVCIFFTILYGVASIAWTWSTIKYK